MDINWDQIQQILTFLIIFIAPALLSKFKKDDTEDGGDREQRLGGLKIEDLAGHKPVVLKDIQKSQEVKSKQAQKVSKSVKEKKVEKFQELGSFHQQLKKQPIQVDRDRMNALNESFKSEVTHKKVFLMGMSAKKAMLLKEILGPPRGVEPY